MKEIERCPDALLTFKFAHSRELKQTYGDAGHITDASGTRTGPAVGKTIFGCCGMSEISGMTANLVFPKRVGSWPKETNEPIPPEVLDRARQDWLCTAMRRAGITMSYCFVITSEQIKLIEERSVFQLLLDMGARQVDNTPNQLHGPSKLLLHVWHPNLNRDKLARYVDSSDQSMHDSYRQDLEGSLHHFNPRWWTESTPEFRADMMKKHPTPTLKQVADKQKAELERMRLEREQEQKDILSYQWAHKRKWFEELGIVSPSNNVVTQPVKAF